MNPNPGLNWRSNFFKMLQIIAPEGSSLDAVFGSYDDWREVRQKTLAERAAKAALKQSKSK
jgi:hypothetical protein